MTERSPAPLYQGLPLVTAGRMREIDRLAAEQRGLRVIDLMENAGRAVAAETLAFLAALGQDPRSSRVAVCCGRGANGGDGLVAARVLKESCASVWVCLCAPRPEKTGTYPEPVAANLERVRALGLAPASAEDAAALGAALERADVVLDGVLGTGASGPPAGAAARVISAIAASGKPVVSIDIPSGLDPDTGGHEGVCVTAALTLALGLPKQGLAAAQARPYVGVLKVLDIGFPKDLLTP